LQKIQKWLNVVDPTLNYSSALKLREPGTGNWLLQGREYMDWKEGRRGLLWLHGIPGCGKSVLSATAIQDVEKLCKANDDYALAYFYFTFSDSGKQNMENMLLSIIGQLPKRPSELGLPAEAVDLYNRTGAIRKSVGTEALKDVLSHIIKGFGKTFIILDALDELPRVARESLLSWIGELSADHKEGSLSILVTSRPEADIVGSLERLNPFAISLQSSNIDPDIRAYIRNSLAGKDGFRKFSQAIKSEIEEKLVSGSQGMFRWVDCVLRVVEECITPTSVRDALRELPKDLDSIYERILDTIPEKQKEYIRRAMNWLAFSAVPLTLGQLAEAIVMKYEVNNYGEDSEDLFDMKSLMSICPSLISFEDAGNDESSTHESRRLRLAHFSVKEYLISDRSAQTSSAYYHISEVKANLRMGHACLSRILRHRGEGTLRLDEAEHMSFLYHSAHHWFTYFRPIEYMAPTPLSEAPVKVLELGQGWLDIYDPDDPWRDEPEDSGSYPSAIYYCSLLGLATACKLLVNRTEDRVNVNAQGGEYGNALQAAAANGNEAVVGLLLERGADVNAQGGGYGNALQAAALNGNESVVGLLLERGANVNAQDVNAQGGEYGNALQAAALNGNETVVGLLLDRGADVNAQGGYYGNALQAAALNGNETVVELLLERGADVNAHGGPYGNALRVAQNFGHESIVQFLLTHGADPNS
ncbi:unnamed protein product, partial [Tuber aestivum]